MSRSVPDGATVWLTGLSGAGKTTIGDALVPALAATGARAVLLDGDRLRRGLSRDLGFSPADRAEQARRTAQLAALLAGDGLVAVVALVSPLRADRAAARTAHVAAGVPFLEVWVRTSLRECERRDPKGLYARARAGELTGLTGVDAPYEPPCAAELVVATEEESAARAAARIAQAVRSAASSLA
ncbi:adenylyl-sulfate kinase [Paraconexibacter algicola]|uniref:Adenylyl-sulfate kinase n=1 Tax=Paraconexibacter algicola TaxID=2133960 RepID=A0A2T4UKW8_9ACTN|nr:adenylyl-sulfate kinase [Paraconexibacter algicola]